MRNFRNLETWRLAMMISRHLYSETRAFPADEHFGLRQQMRRSAVSIASNVAEGASRDSDADFRRFLFMAKGSAAELETQLLLASDLGYVDVTSDSVAQLLDDIDRSQALLSRLIKGLTNEDADSG
jgi:four helix bundle protein